MGLDHIRREEKPQRSLLTELPDPVSLPDGVIFLLGTQTLELDDLRPSVRHQAASEGRLVNIAALTCWWQAALKLGC